jgi:hypothetical protein
MNSSLFRKEVMPFMTMFGLLIVTTVIVDVVLHQFKLVWVGRWLGIPGVILIVLSFLYSMRKRNLIQFGKPKSLLTLHEALTWTGALMILIHGGIHIYTLLPWIALFFMLINIISGMTGTYLLRRSRLFIANKKTLISDAKLSELEKNERLFWDATTFELMKKWRTIHLPITFSFVALAIAHVLSVFVFWEWK